MKLINIISEDKVFAHMLSTELTRRGYNTGVNKSISKSALLVIDLDTALSKDKTLPNITFSRETECDIIRPFSINELVILIEERSADIIQNVRKVHRLDLFGDKESSSVIVGNERIHLSLQEYALFEALLQNADNVIPKAELSNIVWGKSGSDNRLRVYIKYLRDKLEGPFGGRLIYSVRNEGYIMKLSD